MNMLSRCGVLLLFPALMAGCSVIHPDAAAPDRARVNECAGNRAACMYEGSYEPGERQYAEDEARRLNQASLEKLRRARIR